MVAQLQEKFNFETQNLLRSQESTSDPTNITSKYSHC